MRSPFIHEARLQKRTDGKVHCLTCERCCLLADEEEPTAGNLKPDKDKSAEKIDGIVALVMALGRAALRTDHTSVYQKRGLLSV